MPSPAPLLANASRLNPSWKGSPFPAWPPRQCLGVWTVRKGQDIAIPFEEEDGKAIAQVFGKSGAGMAVGGTPTVRRALHTTLRALFLQGGKCLLHFPRKCWYRELICPRSPSWDFNPGLPAAKGCCCNQHNTLPKNFGSPLAPCRGWVAGAFYAIASLARGCDGRTQTAASKPGE